MTISRHAAIIVTSATTLAAAAAAENCFPERIRARFIALRASLIDLIPACM